MKERTFNITLLPEGRVIDCGADESLLEAFHRAGIPFVTDCGGAGKCGRCAVKVLSGEYTCKPHHRGALEEGWTLACLTTPDSGLELYLAPDRGRVTVSVSPEEFAADFSAPAVSSPLAAAVEVEVPPADESDNSSDLSRASKALERAGHPGVDFTLEAVRKLPGQLREAGRIVCSLDNLHRRVFDIIDGGLPKYGLAVDLGTTTVEALLVNLDAGEPVARGSTYNLQMSYGSDIIHRIIAAGKNPERLREFALLSIEDILKEMLYRTKLKRRDIIAASVAGNTTMTHLLLGIDPANIRLAPYVPVAVTFPPMTAREIGLKIHPESPVSIAPGVASYVGGDIAAGMSAVDFAGKLTLYIDLGTNGEIALGDGEWFAGCACSCGPAFEGGGIGCGMRAGIGAAERVKVLPGGEVELEVIGGGEARGICGSGLIDIMAGLFRQRIIDGKGRFRENAAPGKIIPVGRRKAFLIPAGAGRNLSISEAEIDNLIRAKGALMAGARSLLKELSLGIEAVERVLVAGNFGRHLDMENAVAIGLLPDLPRERFEFIGNASLRGAYLSLLSGPYRERASRLAGMMTNIELSTLPGYTDEFVAASFLPHTDGGLFPLSGRG